MTMLADLIECIAPRLADVERLFERELRSDLRCVNTLVKHVSRFRGKMLRPCLVLLSGQAAAPGQPLNESHVAIATVVEMVHMATLVHDDILDDAELRRKGATINHLRGNEAAVLLGDYLISHAYHLCSSLDSQAASRLIGRTTNEVCEGELLQIDNRNNIDLDETTYYQIITRKTASLTAACCELGARQSRADENVVRALREYGLWVGTAFQVQDDVLDLVGDVSVVGKSLGSDIDKGKLTLPMIHFLATAPAEHGQLLRSLLQCNDPDRGEKIRNLILPSDAITYARDAAAAHIRRAVAALGQLPDSEPRRVLEQMASFVLDRAL